MVSMKLSPLMRLTSMMCVFCLFVGTSFAYNVAAKFEPSAINVLTWDLQDTSGQNFIPMLYNLGPGGSPPVPIVEVPYVSPYSVGPFTTGNEFNSFLGVPYASLYNDTNPFSLTMWVQYNKTFSALGGSEILLSAGTSGHGGHYKIIRQASRYYLGSVDNLFLGEGLGIGWHFIVLSYNATNQTTIIYIDNSSIVNSTSLHGTYNINQVVVGAEYDGNNPAQDFLINQITFYNNTLTGADVDALATNTTATGNYSAPASDFEIYSFPQNLNKSLGFGNVFSTSLGTADTLAGTTYGIKFDPSIAWYSNGYPADGTYLVPGFVIKYKGDYITPYQVTALPFEEIQMGFTSTNANKCWVYTGTGSDSPIETANWAAMNPSRNTLYLPADSAPPLLRNTNPILFLGRQIYCTENENLTAHFYIVADGMVETDYNFVIPVGYYIYNNGTVDYTRNASHIYTSGAPPGLNTSGVPGPGPDISDPMVVVNLLLKPQIIVMVMVVAMGVLAAFVGGAVLGIAAMIGGLLILSIIGLIPIWVALVLIIVSAFIAAKQVQGVFTPK